MSIAVCSVCSHIGAWTPPGVHKVYTMQDKGWHGHRLAYTRCTPCKTKVGNGHRLAYTRCTPCKTKVGMVTAWRTRGVHHARQGWHGRRLAYTRCTTCKTKGWHGHRLAYIRPVYTMVAAWSTRGVHHARQRLAWPPPGVHAVYTMQDKRLAWSPPGVHQTCVHHARQRSAWSPPGVQQVNWHTAGEHHARQKVGMVTAWRTSDLCTPCKTKVGMVTAWRTRGVHHARQRLAWSPPGVHEVYTMQDKRLAWSPPGVHQTCVHHARQRVAWSPPGVHEVYTMQDKGWHGHRLAYSR